MASGATQHDSTAGSTSRSAKLVAYEHFIEAQLRKTAGGVKAVDLTSALMTMAAAALFYFLAVALLDHWLVPGGLGRGGRFFFLVALLVVGGYYFARHVLPLLMGRINPLYSAHTIEQSSPSLKNSLINFLLFRRDREVLPEPVYQALEVQAAKRLSAVQVDTAIDRSKIVRLGYVLLGVVIAYALYMVISPKNPLATAGRVLLPWSDIQAPSRVTIQNIEPGNAVGSQAVLRGGRLTISAEVLGIEPDEPVTLYYTSTDAQSVDRAVKMFVPEGALRYECQLPEPDTGLYVDFTYRIEAGDAISTTYQVEVVARPQIVVETVDYEYPKYTRLTDRSVTDQGDLKAIEGTRVTVRARANYPIGSAWIDFDADGRSDLVMNTEGDEATASFVLKLSKDRHSAWHNSYSLRFSNHQGRRNREPVQYRIEVTPDLAPEITILAPTEEVVEVPLDGEVIIETQALDPDFALAKIDLRGTVSGKQAFRHQLLNAEHQGQWNHKYRLVPRRAGLRAGDLVEYWAEVQDNKAPSPNLARTNRSRRLRIVAPENSSPEDQPKPKQEEPGKTPPNDPSAPEQGDPKSEKLQQGQKQSEDTQGEDGEQGESGEGQQGSGSEGQSGKQGESSEGKQGEGEGQQSGESQENSDQSGPQEGEGSEEGVANDGSDDGGAFQKILEELKEKQGKGEKPSPEEGQQEGKQEGASEGSESESGGSESGEKPQNQDGGQQGSDPSQKSDGGSDPSGKESSGKDPSGQQKPEGNSSESKEGQQGESSSQEGSKSDSGSETSDKNQSSDEGQPSGEKLGGAEKPSEGDSPGKEPGKQDSGSEESADGKQAEGEKGGKQGEGAESKRPGAEPGQKPSGKEEERPDAKGGDGSNEKGNSGAGKKGSDDAGSPSPEPGTAPKNNKKPGEGSEEGGKEKPKSPAHGNKESNSDGSQGGDKSGGGEEGGGQKANRRGTGSAGQNTAADEGGGQAEESGEGDTSDKSGNDVKSDRSTDDPGKKETGKGSKQQPGKKPSGNNSSDSEQSGEGKSSPRNDSKQGKEGQGRPSAANSDDQKPNEPNGGSQAPESDPGGDEADLEYARKATDLVLEHLEHDLEKDQVDTEMLDKLGWSQEDLRKFVQRWKNLKQDSRSRGDQGKAARQELNEALRSLGLRSGNVTRGGTRGSDKQGSLRESHRIPPPPGYAEQLKAYRRGLSETRPVDKND